jgi:hypothetical protein
VDGKATSDRRDQRDTRLPTEDTIGLTTDKNLR